MPKVSKTPRIPKPKVIDETALAFYRVAVGDAANGDSFVMLQAPAGIKDIIKETGKVIKCVKTAEKPNLVFVGAKTEKEFVSNLNKWFPKIMMYGYLAGSGYSKPKLRATLDNFFLNIKGPIGHQGDIWYYKKIPQ